MVSTEVETHYAPIGWRLGMATATILFIDIVGYSKRSTVAERELLEMFNNKLRPGIRHLFGLKPHQLLCLPTGDGAALAFLHRDTRTKWKIEHIVDLIFDLQSWARSVSKPGSEVSLRIGVHFGHVEVVKDINQRPNICGAAINMAQRIMDGARPRQVLFSDEAVRHHIGKEQVDTWKVTGRRHQLYKLGGPFELQVKHQELLTVYRLVPEGVKGHGWNADDPEIKFWLSVSPTDVNKPIKGTFSERLSKAVEIALVQLTGRRLIADLRQHKVHLNKDLRRLYVFLPAERYCVHPDGRPNNVLAKHLRDRTQEWIKFAKQTRKRLKNAVIEVRRYNVPPYYGGSYLDWKERGGFIHVSPYIWGVPPENCPGFNISWVGTKPLQLYRTYQDGLENLLKGSKVIG